jgi:catechol 2,3-dioxygenase-like lactoylglutathione lyase family enzyme
LTFYRFFDFISIIKTLSRECGAVIRIRKIAHASFETNDLERQVAYYSEVLGLTVAAREPDAVHLASTLDRQSVVLRRVSQAHCARLAFQLAPGTDMGDFAAQLSAHGVSAQRRSDPEPGIAACVSFQDPKGTWIDVHAEAEMSGQNFSSQGIVPLKLGHVAFNVPDVQGIVSFYEKVLGFRVSDWMGDFFCFMRCGPDHHTVNFVKGDTVKMHHIAFELRDWAHVEAACDILGRHAINLIWGPGRHSMGHNIFTYHYNPDGQIIEMYTELDRINDEELGYFEPRPWHEDRPQRPKVWEPSLAAANQWGVPAPADFLK